MTIQVMILRGVVAGVLALASAFSMSVHAQEDGLIEKLLRSRLDLFGQVLEQVDKHEV